MNKRNYFFAYALSLATIPDINLAVEIAPTQSTSTITHPRISMPHSPALQQQLEQAYQSKGTDYQARTEHMDANGKAIYLNRLILEDSPYLLQHAHNPVNWYAWGDDAFAAAKSQNKPIFLSIGYSTCHWCHVMEEESFDNPQIAQILNEHFISIKVDREQRPDIDSAYMTAVMMLTQHGGWPMSSFLTPEGKTFFGGTYFPPQNFAQLLTQVAAGWRDQPQNLIDQAQRIADAVAKHNEAKSKGEAITDALVKQAVKANLSSFDAKLGGFSPAPKFPNETIILFLLDQQRRSPDAEKLTAIRKTLDALAQGGIHDQIGGGFARYATDASWLIPHFEKMLYNQALLARCFSQAYQLTGDSNYQRTAQQILNYVLRDMTTTDGAFYSATDADSEGHEGLFFVWSVEQIKKALSAEDAKLALKLFAITESGNFEGRNILNLPISLAEYAKQNKIQLDQLYLQVDRIREQLRVLREQRIHPLRDDKILTAWNAMLITALAEAGSHFQAPEYTQAAMKAADYLWQLHRKPDNTLWRASLNGKTSVAASQEDYAYLAEAFLSLYDVSAETRWLERATLITDKMLELFWDGIDGAFYMNEAAQAVPILARPKDLNDGATPSGNAVALRVLALLSRRTETLNYDKHANSTLGALAASVRDYPASFGYLLNGREILQHAETGSTQFAARGAVRIVATISKERINIQLFIKPGWHINAHKPLQDNLIATTVKLNENKALNQGWSVASTIYPEAETKTLGFQKQPLALYEGEQQLQVLMKTTQQNPLHLVNLQLTLQACNELHCLAPETIHLQIAAQQEVKS